MTASPNTTDTSLNICSVIKRSSTIYSKDPLFILPHTELSYQTCWSIASDHREWIQNQIRHHFNEAEYAIDIDIVVAYLAPNSPDLLLSMIGCLDIASSPSRFITAAMLNTRWTTGEIARVLEVNDQPQMGEGVLSIQKHATVILYGSEYSQCAKESVSAIRSNRIQQKLGHFAIALPLPDFISALPLPKIKLYNRPNFIEKRQRKRDMHSDAILLFTSGTTSGAKGVRLSHLSLFIQAFSKTTSPCNYNRTTKMLATTVPFFHVGGLSSALAVIMAGGSLVFPEQQGTYGFNSKIAIQSMTDDGKSSRVNLLVLVPAMLQSILNEAERKNWKSSPLTFPGVQLLLIGGQSLTMVQLNKSKRIFPNAKIVQTYACTEAGSSITFGTLHDPTTVTTQPHILKAADVSTSYIDTERHVPHGLYAGYPPPHVELQIFKLDQDNKLVGEERVATYVVGVIATRGPHIMTSYWWRGQDDRRESEIKHGGISTDPNRWFITNDLGYLDERGGLYFCGRLNEVIRSGGESIYAPEVEHVLLQHSQVESCAVFALPHSRFGECVCAAIVLRGDQNKTQGLFRKRTEGGFESDVNTRNKFRTFCKEHDLSGFKSPWIIFIVKDLPQNSSGKVLKHELARICLELQKKQENDSRILRSKL